MKFTHKLNWIPVNTHLRNTVVSTSPPDVETMLLRCCAFSMLLWRAISAIFKIYQHNSSHKQTHISLVRWIFMTEMSNIILYKYYNMSWATAFPTTCTLRRLKSTCTSVRAGWSESFLSVWRLFASLATHRVPCEDWSVSADAGWSEFAERTCNPLGNDVYLGSYTCNTFSMEVNVSWPISSISLNFNVFVPPSKEESLPIASIFPGCVASMRSSPDKRKCDLFDTITPEHAVTSQLGFYLTHWSLEIPKRVTGKQCRPRSDAAKRGVWSGSFTVWK